MSQVFHRSANTLSKVGIVGILLLVLGLIGLVMVLGRSSYVTRAEEYIEQPIQFSHLHHVADDGIDCRYCHTSVETSSFAGIPPTKTCMNCHSQIWSTAPDPGAGSRKLSRRPTASLDSRARPAGLRLLQSQHPREEGHGLRDMPRARRPDAADVQENSLQMEWCLNCHRNPEKLRASARAMCSRWAIDRRVPQSVIGPQLVKEYGIRGNTNCSTCHR